MNALCLLRGDNLKLTDEVQIIHPKLKRMTEVDLDKYNEYLSTMISTSMDIADILWVKHKVFYKDIKSEWDFFVQKSVALSASCTLKIVDKNDVLVDVMENCLLVNPYTRDSLNFFLNLSGEYVVITKKTEDLENVVFYNVQMDSVGSCVLKENAFAFTEHFYNITLEYLKTINWISPEYDFDKGGNDYAKKKILEMEYKRNESKRNRKEKQTVNLSSIVSSLIAKGQPYKDIWEYPIYLIYDLYYRLLKVDEYKNTIQALYSGCIDTKKNPINWDKINWSAIIK